MQSFFFFFFCIWNQDLGFYSSPFGLYLYLHHIIVFTVTRIAVAVCLSYFVLMNRKSTRNLDIADLLCVIISIIL